MLIEWHEVQVGGRCSKLMFVMLLRIREWVREILQRKLSEKILFWGEV